MLEILVSPWQAENKPLSMFLFGFLFTVIAFAVTVQFINLKYAGLVSVFFVVLILTPLMFQIFQRDEDSVLHTNKFFPKHHQELLLAFLALFMGIAFAYLGWYLILPTETADAAFSLQSASVEQEFGLGISLIDNPFWTLFFINLQIFALCLIFSYYYGVGALFVLIWNASALGIGMGQTIRSGLGSLAANPVPVIQIIIGKFLLHTIPKMMAYFLGCLAIGLISIAITRYQFRSNEMKRIGIDAVKLCGVAVILLGVSAFVEMSWSRVQHWWNQDTPGIFDACYSGFWGMV